MKSRDSITDDCINYFISNKLFVLIRLIQSAVEESLSFQNESSSSKRRRRKMWVAYDLKYWHRVDEKIKK